MSMTYTKLFSSITESTIWGAPDHVRLTWITMLAMADRRGRVWASIPGLANRARVTVEQAQESIISFLGPDKFSRTTSNEGRRIEAIDGGWRLLNHEKYRAIRDEEAVKESKRRYINKRRDVENVERSRTLSNQVDGSRDIAEADPDTDPTPKAEAKAAKMQKPPPTPSAARRWRTVTPSVDSIALPESFQTVEFVACWEALKAHRGEIHKKFTPLAAKKLLERFEVWGVERAVAAINYSISMGWQGVFEPQGASASPGFTGRRPEQTDTDTVLENWERKMAARDAAEAAGDGEEDIQ